MDTDDPRTGELYAPLEAILMVTDRPITAAELADALDLDLHLVDEALRELAAE